MKEFNQDQTPLRHRPPGQYTSIENTDKANFNDGDPVQQRLQEVTVHSQDLQPSNYAARNNPTTAQATSDQYAQPEMQIIGDDEQIDAMANAQRFLRD